MLRGSQYFLMIMQDKCCENFWAMARREMVVVCGRDNYIGFLVGCMADGSNELVSGKEKA